MKNYTKVLSLAAILALSTASYADTRATYTPLTTKAKDRAWIMFGVNGFATGIPSDTTPAGVFSNGYSVVEEDSLSDDNPTPLKGIGTTGSGIFDSSAASGSKNMATFQALKDASGNPYFTGSSLKMAIPTSTRTYTDTEPVRSMYIAIEPNDTVAKIKLNYKAALEGQPFEIQIDGGSTIYKGTISQTATFSTPAVARDTVVQNTGTEKTTPEDTLVYNLGNAPIDAKAYDITKHQGTAAGNTYFYRYDAANEKWLLWRSSAPAGVNDITAFEKGYAYWGRMDINADDTTTSTARAGLYLGNNTGLDTPDATVYTDKLTPDAWNMVAFDPANNAADIRNATTGLIVTFDTAATGSITILDESGQNSVDVSFDNNTTNVAADRINLAIDKAKVLGTVPSDFNIRTFAASATDLIFISDARFTLKDINTTLSTAKTLAGKDPIDTATGNTTTITDLNSTGATSVYGEFAMIVEPLVGANTASELDNTVSGSGGKQSAAVWLGNIEGDTPNKTTLAADNVSATLASVQTNLQSNEIFAAGGTLPTDSTGTVTQLDSNNDGTTDMLLLAADKPFYIKDNTFTRVYATDATSANGKTITVQPADVTTGTIGANTVAAIETVINNIADDGTNDTAVFADIDPNDATKLVIVSNESPILGLDDVGYDTGTSTAVDLFSRASSTSDIAKGAIKRVVDLAKLSRSELGRHKWTFSFLTDANGADGGSDDFISINGASTTSNPVTITATTNDTERIALLQAFVDGVNADMDANGIAGFAYYTYTDGLDDITQASITVEGVGITSVSLVEDDGGLAAGAVSDANSATADKINIDGALLTSDLKENAIYTPDYVSDGPLYTLKKAGYEAKALITSTTKLDAPPLTNWRHIDLTRSSDQWFANNEFNLFNVNENSGYWAYVTSYTDPAAMSVGTTVFNPGYRYHFNNVNNTTENLIQSATVSVEVLDTTQESGKVNPETSNSKLIVAGEEVQLMKSGTAFTAVLTDPATGLEPASTPISIGLRVANGFGERLDVADVFTLDYTKPAAPTMTFTANTMTLASTSADVASYYMWETYIPDNLANPVASNITEPVNMCFNTAFGSTTTYKVVAADGSGVLGSANLSDITSFSYLNATKDATIITHSYGEAASTVVAYDDICALKTDAQKYGFDVRAMRVGTVRVAYQAMPNNINSTTDIPLTAYFKDGPNGNIVVEIDYYIEYASQTVYVEWNGVLYSATLPADRDAADATLSSPIALTAVSTANQTLAQQ